MSIVTALNTDPAFELAFRMREPASAAPSALLVLLHGVGGDETNLSELAAHVSPNTLVVLPRGRLELGVGQYAWFRVAFTEAGPQIIASEAEASRIALIHFVTQLQAAHGIAPERTVIAGFSQGGILSASVGLTAPERVGGFAVLAGRILPELEPILAPANRLQRVEGLIAHGRDDGKLPVFWAERAHAWLERLGVRHDLRLYPGGHGITPAMAQDFLHWMEELLPPIETMAQLILGAEDTRLLGALADQDDVAIAPGIERLLREHFRPHVPQSMAMETAIAAIEDDLAKVPASVRGITVASGDPRLLAIATAAGLDASAPSISRIAVEHVFGRLTAVAMSRPASVEGLPPDPEFSATMLVVRELMHHLDIHSIFLRHHQPNDPVRTEGDH